jgi:hypothetical protein
MVDCRIKQFESDVSANKFLETMPGLNFIDIKCSYGHIYILYREWDFE